MSSGCPCPCLTAVSRVWVQDTCLLLRGHSGLLSPSQQLGPHPGGACASHISGSRAEGSGEEPVSARGFPMWSWVSPRLSRGGSFKMSAGLLTGFYGIRLKTRPRSISSCSRVSLGPGFVGFTPTSALCGTQVKPLADECLKRREGGRGAPPALHVRGGNCRLHSCVRRE